MKHARLTYMTPEEYLALEQASDTRHDYVNGQMYAMVGVKDVHNRIALNIASFLRAALRGSACQVYMSDVKVRVAPANVYYYPDVFVTCDRADTDPYVKSHPCLVVEVLSPNTEGTDRREKLIHYRELPSLREYVLVGSETRQVEVYRRESDAWTLDTLTEDNETFELQSVGQRMSVSEVYEGVTV